MKNKGLLFVLILLFSGAMIPCLAQEPQEDKAEQLSANVVDVYYFHYERRCATCVAVEEETEKAIGELYPGQVKSGEMRFQSVNLEDEANNELAEGLKISGQSLLVVKGEKQKNLTNEAFMYAKSNPDRLKKELKKTIDKML